MATTMEEAIRQIATYKYGQSRKPLLAVEKLVRDWQTSPKERARIRKQLAALLASDATADCKRFVCQQLSIIATDDEVPAIAPLLTDEDLSHMARLALERIPGKVAAAALRRALGKVKGKLLVGVINSIGERRDERAVGDLGKLVGDSDPAVACAAAAALGKIGGGKAAKVLATAKKQAPAQVRPTVVDACLCCAERLFAEGKRKDAARIYEELTASSEAKHVRYAASIGLQRARPPIM